MTLTNESFKEMISELLDREYPEAAKALAKVYLTHENDNSMIGQLARAYYDLNEYQGCLFCLDKILPSLEEQVKRGTNDVVHLDSLQINRAKCFYYLRKADKALELLDSISKKRSTNIEMMMDRSLYLNAVGRFQEARQVLEMLPDQTNPAVCFNRAWYLFRAGEFKKGYANIVKGSELKVWGNEWEMEDKWQIGPDRRWVYGEHVDILAFTTEGGIGDELTFIRFTQHLHKYCRKLKIFCHKKLVNFFIECGYKNVYPHDAIVDGAEKWDKYVPAMSSPYYLQLDSPRENITFPYLVRPTEPVPEMDEVANGRKKILLKWSGNPEFEHDQFRTFPVDPLWDLSKYGQLFSVQFENDGDMTKNAPIWDLKHLMDSWQDTYDIIANSDLLITSCTAVAHMAGGMGKKVIVIVPMVPYMIWPDHGNADEYWYEDNVTIIRQKEYGTWKHAMDELYEVVPKILES